MVNYMSGWRRIVASHRQIEVILEREVADDLFELMQEERKLLRYHGESLREYLQDVIIKEGLLSRVKAVNNARAPHIIQP